MTACGNMYLAGDLNRFKLMYRAFRDLNYTRDEVRNDRRRLVEEADEHLAIVEAIAAGNRLRRRQGNVASRQRRR